MERHRITQSATNDRIDRAQPGAIVSVRGSVVDVRFDERLPTIYSLLRAGPGGHVLIEVWAQLNALARVRCLRQRH